MDEKYRLIVGLGNSGQKYENTYHNVGYVALDMLRDKVSERVGAPSTDWKYHKKSNSSVLTLPGAILVRPECFMNTSGEVVKKALDYFNAAPEEALVIHDDIDLPVGEVRVEFSRGAAGHKGITSIISALGTKKFWRMRVGIGDPKRDVKAEQKVLRRMGKEERDVIYSSLEEAIENVIEKMYPPSAS